MTPEAFWAFAKRVGPCLEWQGSKTTEGYGRLRHLGQMWGAHRVAWTLARGPIPEGLNVLHTCDNPPCIEPLHLFLGTLKDNWRDMRAKGRRPDISGERHPNAQLTDAQVVEMRAAYQAGETARSIATRFRAKVRNVEQIVGGRRRSPTAPPRRQAPSRAEE